MSLFENVVMIIVLVIALLMFYNVVIFTNNTDIQIDSISQIQELADKIDKEIQDMDLSSPNFESDLASYISDKETTEKVIITYTLEDKGVYLKIQDSMKNSEINIFKTLGAGDEK